MKHWQILNAEPKNYCNEALEILNSIGNVRMEQLDRKNLIVALGEVEVLIIRLATQIDDEIFASAPHLKVVVSATTGLDHIDLVAAKRHGVKVLSLQGEVDFLRTIPATAELTWALLLALTRRVPFAFDSVRNGNWNRDLFKGHDLSGRTLAILGLGRIGHIVSRYGLAFGMRVIAYDPKPIVWEDGVEKAACMSELLVQSDILTIHVPLNTQTVHLIGKDELDLLPSGALVINTSRGNVLEESALIKSLIEGKISGAALDVLSDERSIMHQGSPIIDYSKNHDNLILTPHIGGATFESMAATEIFMAKKTAEYLKTL